MKNLVFERQRLHLGLEGVLPVLWWLVLGRNRGDDCEGDPWLWLLTASSSSVCDIVKPLFEMEGLFGTASV